MKKLLFLVPFMCMFSGQAQAEELVHVGVGAGMNTAMYIAFSAALGRSPQVRLPALIASSGFTFLVSVTSEVNDSSDKHTSVIDTHDLAMDALGIGISALGIYLVDIYGSNVSVSTNGKGLTFGYRW